MHFVALHDVFSSTTQVLLESSSIVTTATHDEDQARPAGVEAEAQGAPAATGQQQQLGKLPAVVVVKPLPLDDLALAKILATQLKHVPSVTMDSERLWLFLPSEPLYDLLRAFGTYGLHHALVLRGARAQDTTILTQTDLLDFVCLSCLLGSAVGRRVSGVG